MKRIYIKGLLLCSLFAMNMGLQSHYRLFNDTGSKIQFTFVPAGKADKYNIQFLGAGASEVGIGDGPTFLLVAGASSYAPWHRIDCEAKLEEVRKNSHDSSKRPVWNIVATTFGYDVNITWESFSANKKIEDFSMNIE